MRPAIIHIDSLSEFYIDEGCYITELSNDTEDPDVSIARARVKPGITTKWHHLSDTVERYVILQGRGMVEIEGLLPERVRAGDTVRIPVDCLQRITNDGEDDLVFLAICSPRFLPENYSEGNVHGSP